jgi:hypothetical protein
MTLELLTARGLEYTELAAELHPVVGKLNVSLEIRFPLRLSNSTVGLGNLTPVSRFESANYNAQRRLDSDQNESGSLTVLNSVARSGSACFWASRIRILPFPHKGVEQTEKMLTK